MKIFIGLGLVFATLTFFTYIIMTSDSDQLTYAESEKDDNKKIMEDVVNADLSLEKGDREMVVSAEKLSLIANKHKGVANIKMGKNDANVETLLIYSHLEPLISKEELQDQRGGLDPLFHEEFILKLNGGEYPNDIVDDSEEVDQWYRKYASQ